MVRFPSLRRLEHDVIFIGLIIWLLEESCGSSSVQGGGCIKNFMFCCGSLESFSSELMSHFFPFPEDMADLGIPQFLQ